MQSVARVTLRISTGRLMLAVANPAAEALVDFEPFTVRSGMSMAANLREAFKESALLLRGYRRAQVLLDEPTVLLPVEEYEDEKAPVLYRHAILGHEADDVLHTILPELNCVALFCVNKDLRVVLGDHFDDIRFLPLVLPVWRHMHRRSFTSPYRKLYGYFHDRQLCVFAFDKNRFRFCNSFDVDHSHDAVYFLLYVWQQLGMDARHDELHLAGDLPDRDELLATLRRYVQKAFAINPTAEFNRAPITQIKGIPLDLVTLYLK